MRKDHSLIDALSPLVGTERSLHDIHYALKVAVRALRFPVVGALHVTCSDEAQVETVESFQTRFARDLLPRLKFAHRAPLRSSNLGGRFEWDSLRVAQAHYADAHSAHGASADQPMVVVVKISSHVGVEESIGHRHFGTLNRYGESSPCCGALAGVLEGAPHPRADGLRELLRSEGLDRLEILRQQVATGERPLVAALLSARLQARSATLEAQDLVPHTPSLFLIVAATTLNKAPRDSEIVCGLYLIDRRDGANRASYRGLGDRPEAYQIDEELGHLRVSDEGSDVTREARDHRLVVERARTESGEHTLARDQRIEEILASARRATKPEAHLVSALLKTALVALADISPVSAALLLFSQGVLGIHHAYQAHHLVRDVEASGEARRLLADLHQQVDGLPPEKARQVLGVLLAEYGAG
ncbi:MAG: hypothetical protein OES47_07300 [Acidobacteriota bacterium]|nr:hypothetical protein [Acidobacteriota bacterium]